MPKKHALLAKLTRPRLHKAVPRERLFTLLDEAREHKPAICVVGPPGAGKTTLIASWLDARGIKGIWYQVDPGDADLATFFFYLGEAAKPFTRKGQRALPTLTPEYLQDVQGFSRRFFRELFSRLPEGATLVLDNYQEVEAAESFHELIAQAATETPVGLTLVVISRRDPPDCYGRLVANDNVCLVDWQDLQFTLQEVRAVMALRNTAADVDESAAWHRISDGWAAGLTLMMEDRRRGGSSHTGIPAGRDGIFQYFAGSILGKVPEHVRGFLMATAHMPQVPVSIARMLTGRTDAGQILDDLYRRHLFTHRRPADEETFWYHALFREYLKSQAVASMGPDECQSVIRRAAGLLEARGDFDDAIQLYQEACDWQAVTRLVQDRAADLLAKGRGQTLRDWISSLPAVSLRDNPKLRYWLGTSLIPMDQVRARAELEAAFEAFQRDGDDIGQLEATTRIISTYYFEWSSFTPLDRWIDVLEPLIARCSASITPELELDSYCSLLLATLYRRPGHPLLPVSVERVLSFLDSDIDLNRRVAGAIYLLSYAVLGRDNRVGGKALAFVSPFLDNAELSPLHRVWVNARTAYFLYQVGRYEEAYQQIACAESIVELHGLNGLKAAGRLIDSYACAVLTAMRNFNATRQRLDKILKHTTSGRPMDRFHSRDPICYLLSATGDLHQLEIHARAAIDAANETGMPYIKAMSRIFLGEALAEMGRRDELSAVLEEARSIIEGTCHRYYGAEIDLIEAFALFAGGETARAVELLSRGLRDASARGEQFHLLRHNHRILSSVAAEALVRGVEVAYIRDLLRRFRISPPDSSMQTWPWQVQVRTLGQFEIRVDDAIVSFQGKAPKKPLALLKALIAHGGREVPEERLIDSLWPEEEADAARKSLDINVLRLRKLLGGNDTIVVGGESIGLNPQLCWTDVWAFERTIARADEADGSEEFSATAAAVALYRGDFLPAETGEQWTLKARERLRAKYVRLVELLAQSEEAAGHWDKAIAHYVQGLEADDLVEAFHLGLMRCYRSLGRPAEAMSTYRRLRQTLSVVLGIAPSPAAEALAQELREGAAARYP